MLPKTFFLLAGTITPFTRAAHFIKRDNTTTTAFPPCNSTPQICYSPNDTYYETSMTYAIYPVSAQSITAITGSFFDLSWLGTTSLNTSGTDDTPGAERYLSEAKLPSASGTNVVVEILTSHVVHPDGGYSLTFEAGNVPQTYEEVDGGVGVIVGVWNTIDVRGVGSGTLMLWTVRGCSNEVFGFQAVHESALKNVPAILTKEKKMDGGMVGPISL